MKNRYVKRAFHGTALSRCATSLGLQSEPETAEPRLSPRNGRRPSSDATPHRLAARTGDGILIRMTILGQRTCSPTGARLAVAAMQLVFVTWLPAAHMQHHADELLALGTTSQEREQAPPPDLLSECFVCSAALGAGTPAEPETSVSAAVSLEPSPPPALAHPTPSPGVQTYSARAPPVPTA